MVWEHDQEGLKTKRNWTTHKTKAEEDAGLASFVPETKFSWTYMRIYDKTLGTSARKNKTHRYQSCLWEVGEHSTKVSNMSISLPVYGKMIKFSTWP